MLDLLIARARHGNRSAPFPVAHPPLPDRFRGLPVIQPGRCAADCSECVTACPSAAIEPAEPGVRLDLGRCLFCGECERACATGALAFGRDHRLAASTREGLVLGAGDTPPIEALAERLRRLLGRSLRLRQVSAGGCNGCEAEMNALGNVVFDAARFGVEFVASPRHADGVLVTGPVSENMRAALLATWEAVPDPRIAIAAGACACSGGPFRGHPEVGDGVGDLVPVDLWVPGCPPHPFTLLDALLRWLGRG